MSLHDEIMGLHLDDGEGIGYQAGFLNARYAAAELALKADAEVERLQRQLDRYAIAMSVAVDWHDRGGDAEGMADAIQILRQHAEQWMAETSCATPFSSEKPRHDHRNESQEAQPQSRTKPHGSSEEGRAGEEVPGEEVMGVFKCSVCGDPFARNSFSQTGMTDHQCPSGPATCRYCGEPCADWSAEDLARGKRNPETGVGVEYHCELAFYGAS